MTSNAYLNNPVLDTFYFPVGDGHELYVEIIGKENGIPVIFFHGGPGANIGERARIFFDPEKFKVILFDQRGTGKSKPFLGLENNTPMATIEDTEALRKHLGIERWIVFGGSYGSTLGLLYGILHPERIMHMVLRGIFLGRQEDVDWLFIEGAGNFYPLEFEKFKTYVNPEPGENLMDAYYRLMTGDDKEVAGKACKSWANWENSILRLQNEPLSEKIENGDLSAGLLEAHYFVNKMFWGEDNYLLNRAERLKNIPIAVFHGRFDVDCRIKGAYDLKKACPHIQLNVVQLGSHYPYDSPMLDMMIQKMNELADKYGKS